MHIYMSFWRTRRARCYWYSWLSTRSLLTGGESPDLCLEKLEKKKELKQKVNIYNDSLSIMFPNKFKNNNSIIIL